MKLEVEEVRKLTITALFSDDVLFDISAGAKIDRITPRKRRDAAE